jgi:hypothetical protein
MWSISIVTALDVEILIDVASLAPPTSTSGKCTASGS